MHGNEKIRATISSILHRPRYLYQYKLKLDNRIKHWTGPIYSFPPSPSFLNFSSNINELPSFVPWINNIFLAISGTSDFRGGEMPRNSALCWKLKRERERGERKGERERERKKRTIARGDYYVVKTRNSCSLSVANRAKTQGLVITA